MAWRQILLGATAITTTPIQSPSAPSFCRFFSNSTPYIRNLLSGEGWDTRVSSRSREWNGMEAHIAKLESEIGDFNRLLVTCTLKLKKLGIPCKHRKLILKYTHKCRVGLWRSRAEPTKS